MSEQGQGSAAWPLLGEQQTGQAKEQRVAPLEREEAQVRRVRQQDSGWEKEEKEVRVREWALGPPGPTQSVREQGAEVA